ncbi:NAD(P)H-dependent oxidoreductase [Antarctobacter jejuensis]|uniref:NAD(P)H-dependent oxidoreductase n=1 Tax=Antarctobacter jejuensis TaxID=1439938 RepID=UPI003FD1159A
MHVRLVTAHPLPDSLTHRFAANLRADLEARRHSVDMLDLYAAGFDPVLTAEERARYYGPPFPDQTGLQDLDGLILVFPTWWFGLPAILKGWIDRTFLPGVAYQHAGDGGALKPALPRLRSVLAVTTMGAPALYDHLIARRPVFHALKHGIVKPCAPNARFRLLTLHRAEQMTAPRLAGFETRLSRAATHLFPTEQ